MPLLGKKIFVRQKPPADLIPDEELFYCKLTHEVFREYEEFFDRVILCNSLVWTCSYTGRPGLTYQESLDSERRARRFLKKFPSPLKQPILFIATLTERGRLNDMCDDVYIFAKDRYFVGENVEVTHYGTTRSCEITKIILSEKEPKSPVKAEVNGNFKPRKKKCINPSKVKYEVLELEKNSKTVVKAQSVSRPKGSYTRERNKLYLKQHTRCKNGVWKVKDDVVDKAGLEGLEFSDIFVGEKPSFKSSPTKKKGTNAAEKKVNVTCKKSLLEAGKKNLQGKLNFKKETSEESKTTANGQQSANLKAAIEKEEQVKKQIEDEKTRIKELKIKEREKRKEEKRLWTEYMNEWKKPRDDLECDDLKNLPNPTPVDCSIPQDIFGDAIMIMEFLCSFQNLLHVRNSFPRGFNFELLQKVFTEGDIQGPLNDLVQLLLVAIFQLQDADDVEWKEKQHYHNVSAFDDQNVTISKAMDLACAAVLWPSLYHGTILRKMPLDPFSVTEILRLHLLASGSHEKGVYFDQACLPEDPGLLFKIEEPDLLKKLATTSVFQLSPEERIKILKVLIDQLLSCSSIRNLIEENQTSLRSLVMQLRQLRAGYARKLKETAGKSTRGRPPKVRQDEKGKIEAVNGVSNSDMEKIPDEDDDDVNDLLMNGDSQKDIADGDSVSGSLVDEQMDEDKIDVESLTPEQIQEREERKAKELTRLKQDFHRKEREILEKIKKHQSFCFLEPIGRDRAYRRYWIFPTMPGVFVEDEDHFVGKCPLKKVMPQIYDLFPVLMSKDDVPPSYVKKHLQQLNDCRIKASNKENDLKLGASVVMIDSASPLKVRTDLNPRVDFKKGGLEAAQNEEQACLLCKDLTVKDVNGSIIKHCPHVKNIQPFGLCTFSVDTCPVHNVKNNNRTKWAFFYKPEDVESLLMNLNPRGFREASLRKVILRDKETLLTSISKCPYNNLNVSLPVPPQPEVRKSSRKSIIRNSEFADMNPDEALELTFRDTLLDLEENIYVGGLGSIKVPNREAWRISIMQRGYDMQCENLQWGPEKKTDESVFNGEENETDDIMFKSPPVVAKKAVKDMACALLQVSLSIEPRYLTPPLRETEAYKVIKQRVLDKITFWESQKNVKRDCPCVPMSPMERWQKVLMECTSFSQLFVHLSTLERSVAWSRSVLKAYCRTCRRKCDAENMLLCDGCDRGHHLYCLKPPLEKIPEGDWFCRVCKPPEKAVVSRKLRYYDSSDAEELYVESEQEKSDDEVEEEEEEEELEDEGEMQNTCEICDKEDRHGRVGTLVHCASCEAAYHRKCLNLSETPKGKWFCRKCQKRKSKAKSKSWSFSSRRRDAQTYSNLSSNTSKRRAKFQRNEWSASRRKAAMDQSDSEQNSSVLRNRSRLQEKKKARSDSLDVEEISAKRFCRGKGQDRRESSEVEENPFKKVYKDTAKNNERRRSKSRNGDDSLDYKSCLDLLVELIKHPSSWPFLVPVNKKNAPNYHQIIKRPMDFGTIRTKLNNMSYRNNNDFVLDVYLVLQNCELFNPQLSPEYKAAKILGKFVASLLKSYDIYNPFDSKGRKALIEQSVH